MAKLPERMLERGGTYYCRIWVPTDIAPLYGRQLVVRSLRTKDLKTAKSRLARHSIELEDSFEAIRADRVAVENPDVARPQSPATRARFAAIARAHAVEVSDQEFANRAELFSQASEQPARFWRGELGALPIPADFGHEQDAYTYFDHLVAEGDLEAVVAYIVRFRLRKRVAALQRMRATGNLTEFIARADQRLPGLGRLDAVALGRLLLEDELAALRAIAQGDPDPSVAELRAGQLRQPNGLDERSSADPVSKLPVANPISLDELLARWEAEADPSASTLSSWRGIVRDLKSFVGDKADDIARITTEDIVAWKDKLVKAKKAAATISPGRATNGRAASNRRSQ
ncbi:MAG: DUF6538 domain-containing protein [Hyphomicrobiaceae bacterium]